MAGRGGAAREHVSPRRTAVPRLALDGFPATLLQAPLQPPRAPPHPRATTMPVAMPVPGIAHVYPAAWRVPRVSVPGAARPRLRAVPGIHSLSKLSNSAQKSLALYVAPGRSRC